MHIRKFLINSLLPLWCWSYWYLIWSLPIRLSLSFRNAPDDNKFPIMQENNNTIIPKRFSYKWTSMDHCQMDGPLRPNIIKGDNKIASCLHQFYWYTKKFLCASFAVSNCMYLLRRLCDLMNRICHIFDILCCNTSHTAPWEDGIRKRN